MRKIIIGLAAAALLISAAPAFAQIGVEVSPGGVGVGIGRDRDRDYRRDRVYEERRVYRDGDRRGYRTYGAGGGCRVSIRKRLPDGSVVIRRINRC